MKEEYYFFETVKSDRAVTISLDILFVYNLKEQKFIKKRFEEIYKNFKSVFSFEIQTIFKKLIDLISINQEDKKMKYFYYIITMVKKCKSIYYFRNNITIYY
jgi:hypothetical protein